MKIGYLFVGVYLMSQKKTFKSLGQIVFVRFPDNFAELDNDLIDVAKYEYTVNNPYVLNLPDNKLIELVNVNPRTHFDLYRMNYLSEGIWEGLSGRDYKDAIIFFYATQSSISNVINLQRNYNNGDQSAAEFRSKYPNMKDFFEQQKNLFTDKHGKFIAIARCRDVYTHTVGDKKEYIAQIDFNNYFHILENPVDKKTLNDELYDRKLSPFNPQWFGLPINCPSMQAKILLNLIICSNPEIKSTKFYTWLDKSEIVDEGDYSGVGKLNIADVNININDLEDEHVRPYFADEVVKKITTRHLANPEVFLKYTERRINRHGNYTNGTADYMIRISDDVAGYWLPVEVKVDIRNPRNTSNSILSQVTKYTYCTDFKNRENNKSIVVDHDPHGVVLILDRLGVYIAVGSYLNGTVSECQFIDGCNLHHPYWTRENCIDHIENIRHKLLLEIRRSINESHPNGKKIIDTDSRLIIQSTSINENPPARNSLFWWFMIPISLMILAYLSEYDWPIILLIPTIAIVIKNLRSVLKLIGLSIIIFVILVIVLWITYGYLTS
jgi:hypothetical protein